MTPFGEVTKILDALPKIKEVLAELNKMDSEKLTIIVQQQMAPAMHLLSGIQKALDDVNGTLVKLNETLDEMRKVRE